MLGSVVPSEWGGGEPNASIFNICWLNPWSSSEAKILSETGFCPPNSFPANKPPVIPLSVFTVSDRAEPGTYFFL